jgi:imidazole glycerol-phosphate synthase subunit HisH
MLWRKTVRIAVCDVGLGNLRSVRQALLAAAGRRPVDVLVTRDPEEVGDADKVLVPGQGAFGDAVRGLDAAGGGGLREVILRRLSSGAPYFGICLGMQLLFGGSDEAPEAQGLGFFEGRVRRLAGGVDPVTGERLKIPHAGWNLVEPAAAAGGWLDPRPRHFFFAHSYVVEPARPDIVAATTEYGERFVSAIAAGNLFACQFHPEKSQRAGLALLERFIAR